MIYLASPYTHKDRDVMEQRFDAVCRAAGKLMTAGHVVFSPIAHTHPIAVRCELPRGWEFWEQFDREFVLASRKLIVLRIDGWDTSKGVAAEIKIAQEVGIPVEYLDPCTEENAMTQRPDGPADVVDLLRVASRSGVSTDTCDAAIAEIERLRCDHVNELRHCAKHGQAVLWCHDCVSAMRQQLDDLARGGHR